MPVMASSGLSTPHESKLSSEAASPISFTASLGLDDTITPDTSLDASPEPSTRREDIVNGKKRKRSRLSDELSLDAEIAAGLQAEIDASDATSTLSDVKSEDLGDELALATISKLARHTHRSSRGPPQKRQKVEAVPSGDGTMASIGIGADDTKASLASDAVTDLCDGTTGGASTVAALRAIRAAARSSVNVAFTDSLSSTSELSDDVDDDSASDSAVSTGIDTTDEDIVPQVPRRVRRLRGRTSIMPEPLSDDDEDGLPLARRRQDRLAQEFPFPEELEELLLDRKGRERRKLEKSHPEIKTMWQDLEENVPVIKPQQAAQPISINRKLKSFQLEGLDWMIKQEKTQYKGGLLGDEMGMGKTIQAVSLIMSDYPAKQPTLVVVPPVALMQWSNEIGDYTDGKLKVFVFHGQNKATKGLKVSELLKFDVIMISYNTLESLYRKESKGWTRGENIVKEASPIHAIHFHRLILDEAHSIKTRTTGVAKACFGLKSNFKWCLSGTPVQNRIGEFFSLLRFLEVTPFANYYCKKCPCSELHWNVDVKTQKCLTCKHPGLQHVSVFNQELLNPITQPDHPSERNTAMDRLALLTSRIMLRRMKRDHVNSMELPPKEVIIHNEFFGEVERDFSGSIMSATNRQFDTYVSRGVMLNNYANIFGLIMQMRQVANHPDLILKKHANEGSQNVLVCNICDEPAEDAVRSHCKHDFCRACVKSFMQSADTAGGEVDCPRCHIPLAIDLEQPEIEQDEQAARSSSIINRINMQNWTSSTKIEMLVYDLYKLRSKKQTLKSIIFSQFTSMLQLIEWRLRRAGFTTVMLDGSMTPNQRQRSINHFMTDPNCEIFLVSLKAGGVALNLTEASRVFIVDP